MSAIQNQIVAFLKERNPEPMKPRSLARRIGIKNRARSDFNAAVEALIEKGQLRRLDNGKLCLAAGTGGRSARLERPWRGLTASIRQAVWVRRRNVCQL